MEKVYEKAYDILRLRQSHNVSNTWAQLSMYSAVQKQRLNKKKQ